MATQVALNPAIVERAKIIANPDVLTRFQLPCKTQTQWHKAFALGSIVLGILAAYVYMQIHQNAGCALGLVSVIIFLLKSRETVTVMSTEEYRQQCAEIQELFRGVALAFRATWEAVTSVICAELNEEGIATVAGANLSTNSFLERSIRTSQFTYDFKHFKPLIEAFRTFEPLAEQISKIPLEAVTGNANLNPVFTEKFTEVHIEATRLIKGYVPDDDDSGIKAYVENKFTGRTNDDGDKIVNSTAWSAFPLKA